MTASLTRRTTADVLVETAQMVENSGLITIEWHAVTSLLAHAAVDDLTYRDALTTLSRQLAAPNLWSTWIPDGGIPAETAARDLRWVAEQTGTTPTAHVIPCSVRACPGVRQVIAVDRLTAEVIVRGLPGWGTDSTGELTCPRPHGLLNGDAS